MKAKVTWFAFEFLHTKRIAGNDVVIEPFTAFDSRLQLRWMQGGSASTYRVRNPLVFGLRGTIKEPFTPEQGLCFVLYSTNKSNNRD